MTTSKSSSPDPPDLVLENLDWVRALSRRLVSDAASADDLVQRAWLAAQGRRPSSGSPVNVRAWLAGVLRNLARDQWRREARQYQRESRASVEPKLQEAPDDLLERSERSQEVASLVLELDEPFRRLMLLRWFEGLKPAEIAASEGLLSSTVRTRLHRGMEQLRAKLDAGHGGARRDWAMVLIPTAGLPDQGQRVAASAFLKMAVAAALTLLLGGVTWWAYGALGSPAASQGSASLEGSLPLVRGGSQAAALASVGGQVDPAPLSPGVDGVRPRVPVTVQRAVQLSEGRGGLDPLAASKGEGLNGVIVLANGTPVPHVSIRARPPGPEHLDFTSSMTADDSGEFSFPEVPGGTYRLSIAHDELSIRGSGLVTTGALVHRIEIEAIVVDLEVHDEAGKPIPIDRYRRTVVQQRGVDGDDSGSVQSVALTAQGRLTTVVPVGRDYLFTTELSDGRQCTALLPDTQSSDRITLVLRSQAPGFGSLKVAVNTAELFEDVYLSEVVAEHETKAFEVYSKETRTSDHWLEYPALLPGRYRFQFTLVRGGFVGVKQPEHRIEVHAGSEQSLLLETFTGGAVQLDVNASHTAAKPKLAALRVRSRGTAAWEERPFLTRSKSVQRWEATASVNGPSVRSGPWEPGYYELEVTLEGCAPVRTTFRIMEGQVESIRVDMQPIY